MNGIDYLPSPSPYHSAGSPSRKQASRSHNLPAHRVEQAGRETGCGVNRVMIAAEHGASRKRARHEMREMNGKQAGKSIKKIALAPDTPEERKTGRGESERATEIKPLIQQHRARNRKADRNHHKAREIIYPMTPRQSTENREPHEIRAIHRAPYTGQASKQPDREEPRRWGRAMRIGKKGKRQSLDIGSNEPHSHLRRSSSSHPNTPRTRQHQADRPLPTSPLIRRAYPSRPLSFVPPPSPSPLSKSGARRNDKQAAQTPDNAQPPALFASSHLTATHRPACGKQSHGNRDRHGTPRT